MCNGEPERCQTPPSLTRTWWCVSRVFEHEWGKTHILCRSPRGHWLRHAQRFRTEATGYAGAHRDRPDGPWVEDPATTADDSLPTALIIAL